MMHLCPNCKGKLPFLLVYVAFLAAFLAFITGVITSWNAILMGVVFVLGCALGAVHVTCCSCRLCRAFNHDGHHAHHAH